MEGSLSWVCGIPISSANKRFKWRVSRHYYSKFPVSLFEIKGQWTSDWWKYKTQLIFGWISPGTIRVEAFTDVLSKSWYILNSLDTLRKTWPFTAFKRGLSKSVSWFSYMHTPEIFILVFCQLVFFWFWFDVRYLFIFCESELVVMVSSIKMSAVVISNVAN